MSRTLISFATPEYREQQGRLTESAKPWFDSIRSYRPADLPLDFLRANARLFQERRGFGYWAWKPWLILKHLEAMEPGDDLAYCDSPCIFESDPSPLFVAARRHDGIGIFHQKREKHCNSTWTKGAAFSLMNCDEPKYHDGDNLLTTYSVWQKTEKSLAFVREWLSWCQNYDVVSDAKAGHGDRPDFRDHRHDQSIVSLMAIRDNLFTLCDCSQFGDGYRCGECDYPRIINTDRGVVAPWLARPNMSSCIEISTTATCAIRCAYCPQDKLGAAYHGPPELTAEMFERCLDNLIPGDAIYFAGFTEPCIARDFMPMLRLALGRGHRVQLYTTGRGLKLKDAEEVAASDIERITIHLPDAAGRMSHSAGNVPTLDALAKHRNVQVMAMASEPHEAVRHLWDKLPVHRYPMNDRAANLSGDLVPVHYYHVGPIKCGAAPVLDHSVLLPSGDLSLCCMDYSLKHIVGNLATTPYSQVLRGDALNAIRQAQQNGGDVACRRCSCAVPA